MLYFIPHLLVVIVCWFTNPIACLFPTMQSNGRDKLWGIFNLWSTHDNYVDEFYFNKYDTDLIDEETYFGHNLQGRLWRYWYRLRWLKRNTAYGWSYLLFSIPKGKGFQWKGTHWLPFGYHNDYNIGWKMHGGIEKLSYASRIIGLRENNE